MEKIIKLLNLFELYIPRRHTRIRQTTGFNFTKPIIMPKKIISAYIAYKLIKELSTPFTKWNIYKLGLIDKNGNTIKKAETPEEKAAMDVATKLLKNVKKIIAALPFGKTMLGSLAASLFLLKEYYDDPELNKTLDSKIAELINIPIADLITENSSAMLYRGQYITENGEYICLTDDIKPVGTSLGFNIFKVRNINKDSFIYVTNESLTRVK